MHDESTSSETASNISEMTVSELARKVRGLVEDAYGQIRVRGELGRVTQAASGHLYADLKDEKSVLSLVMWKSGLARLGFVPEQGMEIIAQGRLSTYAGRSSYQLIADTLYPAGEGALLIQLEARRRKLAAEGLFDPARKTRIPSIPRVIGVVTSPTGAVIRDILHRIEDRFPCRVLLWPSRVQGKEATAEICAAIEGFNRLPQNNVPRPDVLIVARGGGSVEDLWAFNEEAVVRAVAASQIPLISAIGHETDTTLIDHVADLRAPTPSAAAEFAVPVRADLMLNLEQLATRSRRAMQQRLNAAQTRLQLASARLPRQDALLQNVRQHLDMLSERIEQIMAHLLERHTNRLEQACQRVGLATRLMLERYGHRLDNVSRVLDTVSPLATLERGYSIVQDDQGTLLQSAGAVQDKQNLHIRFADGRIRAIADKNPDKKSLKPQTPKPEPSTPSGKPHKQPRLF